MRLDSLRLELMLLGLILGFYVSSYCLCLREASAEMAQVKEYSSTDVDLVKAAQHQVDEMRRVWKESYEGDPGLANGKFARGMKKVDQEFAPMRALIDKSPESSQKAFALEYVEQQSKFLRERIQWLEDKITTETNPKWKQDLQQHLQEYKRLYPGQEAEFLKSKAELQQP